MSISIFSTAVLVMTLQSTTAIQQIEPRDNTKLMSPILPIDDVESGRDDLDRLAKPDDKMRPDLQVSTETGLPSGAPQLTEGPASGTVNQLSRLDRNTESAPALSERKQGFETATVKLEGSDRCSAELISADDRAFCQQVIENRSSEYAGPVPAQLSPEQRLMGERDFERATNRPSDAARRLATGQDSSDDQNSQAIASLVLNSPVTDNLEPEQTENPADLGSETQALIDAIVTNLAGPK